jgi:hypothetical protein
MFYTNTGIAMFNDLNDLIYNYFMEMGLNVRPDQYLCYQDTGVVLQFKGKYIKASVNGMPAYAGINDIVFEPIHNYGMISNLFGMYLDMCQDTDDGDLLQGYIAHFVEDDPNREKQRVTVKTKGRGEISSLYYDNIFLAYIDCTFRISGTIVDLTPFDIEYERTM